MPVEVAYASIKQGIKRLIGKGIRNRAIRKALTNPILKNKSGPGGALGDFMSSPRGGALAIEMGWEALEVERAGGWKDKIKYGEPFGEEALEAMQASGDKELQTFVEKFVMEVEVRKSWGQFYYTNRKDMLAKASRCPGGRIHLVKKYKVPHSTWQLLQDWYGPQQRVIYWAKCNKAPGAGQRQKEGEI